MRILVLSDLHLEFGPFEAPRTGYDLAILAGDTHPRLGGIKWALESLAEVPILYVAGNHEFYGDKHPRLFEKMRALAKGTRLQVLENEWFELDGLRFFGTSLWTDFRLTGDLEAALDAAAQMNDFTRIRHWPSLRKFSPVHARLLHAQALAALDRYLAAGDASRTVVITHHAPSAESVPSGFRNHPLRACYASNLDEFIKTRQPALWIHGHLHSHQDYHIGRTRILANPRGYVGHDTTHSGFNPNLVIEL